MNVDTENMVPLRSSLQAGLPASKAPLGVKAEPALTAGALRSSHKPGAGGLKRRALGDITNANKEGGKLQTAQQATHDAKPRVSFGAGAATTTSELAQQHQQQQQQQRKDKLRGARRTGRKLRARVVLAPLEVPRHTNGEALTPEFVPSPRPRPAFQPPVIDLDSDASPPPPPRAPRFTLDFGGDAPLTLSPMASPPRLWPFMPRGDDSGGRGDDPPFALLPPSLMAAPSLSAGFLMADDALALKSD